MGLGLLLCKWERLMVELFWAIIGSFVRPNLFREINKLKAELLALRPNLAASLHKPRPIRDTKCHGFLCLSLPF